MKFISTMLFVMLLGRSSTTRAFQSASPLSLRRSTWQSVARNMATVEKTAAPAVSSTKQPDMEEIVSLCKRRGIIFPSSEIYNGFAGFFDYGPLGVELKKNIKDAWWSCFVTQREDVVGLDSSIIHNPTTWKSSGK